MCRKYGLQEGDIGRQGCEQLPKSKSGSKLEVNHRACLLLWGAKQTTNVGKASASTVFGCRIRQETWQLFGARGWVPIRRGRQVCLLCHLWLRPGCVTVYQLE